MLQKAAQANCKEDVPEADHLAVAGESFRVYIVGGGTAVLEGSVRSGVLLPALGLWSVGCWLGAGR